MSETKITPQRTNANRHTARGMQALENSLATDGWIGAITVAADGETFDGSARVEKTAENGMLDGAIVVDSDGTRPIVVRRVDIATATDPRAVRLGIAANRVASLNLEWEPDVLAGIADAGIDLSSLFTADEWADVSMPALPEPGDGGDSFDPTPEDGPTRTHLGELWSIGRHKIACADSSNLEYVKSVLAGTKVAGIWADPPYGMRLETKSFDQRNRSTPKFRNPKSKNWDEVEGDFEDYDPRLLMEYFDGVGEQFWWGADYYSERIPAKNEGSWMVWDKRGESTDSMIGSSFELCWSKQKHRREIIRILWVGILGTESEDVRTRVHPTQKPYRLPLWFFGKFNKPGDVVFDPYLGSGPSIIAAEKLDMTIVGFELSPAYVDVCLARWEAETGQEARLERRLFD